MYLNVYIYVNLKYNQVTIVWSMECLLHTDHHVRQGRKVATLRPRMIEHILWVHFLKSPRVCSFRNYYTTYTQCSQTIENRAPFKA